MLRTVDTVREREREREHNSSELSFVNNAQKPTVEICKKINNKISMKKEKIDCIAKKLYSLSFLRWKARRISRKRK